MRCWRSTQGCNNHINITAILKFMLEIVIHCEIFAPRLTKYLLKETFANIQERFARRLTKYSRLTKGDDFRFAKLLLLLPVLRSIGLESPGSLFCNEATIADNFR